MAVTPTPSSTSATSRRPTKNSSGWSARARPTARLNRSVRADGREVDVPDGAVRNIGEILGGDDRLASIQQRINRTGLVEPILDVTEQLSASWQIGGGARFGAQVGNCRSGFSQPTGALANQLTRHECQVIVRIRIVRRPAEQPHLEFAGAIVCRRNGV